MTEETKTATPAPGQGIGAAKPPATDKLPETKEPGQLVKDYGEALELLNFALPFVYKLDYVAHRKILDFLQRATKV